jgi:hypothetical protein
MSAPMTPNQPIPAMNSPPRIQRNHHYANFAGVPPQPPHPPHNGGNIASNAKRVLKF